MGAQQERGRAEARAHLQPRLEQLGRGLDAASHHATHHAAEQRGGLHQRRLGEQRGLTVTAHLLRGDPPEFSDGDPSRRRVAVDVRAQFAVDLAL